MHAALLIDEQRLMAERAWFSRTVVGLVSAGVQVTRVLPMSDYDDRRIALTTAIHMKRFHLPWSKKSSRQQIAARLRSPEVHLIHAMGHSVWNDAIEIGRMLDLPVILDVWSRDDLAPAARLAQSAPVAALFASTPGLAAALRRQVDPSLVCEVPIGVYIPDNSKQILQSTDRGVAAIIVGQGATLTELTDLVEGFAGLRASWPNFMLFADLEPRVSRRIWELAARRGILDCFSLIPRLDENRRLVLQADIVLVPGTTGRSGSFILEAMASPMVPILLQDEFIACPEDQDGCRIIKTGRDVKSSTAWLEALREVVTDPAGGQRLADQARAWIAKEHRMSQQIAVMHAAYETTLSGGSVPLSTSA